MLRDNFRTYRKISTIVSQFATGFELRASFEFNKTITNATSSAIIMIQAAKCVIHLLTYISFHRQPTKHGHTKKDVTEIYDMSGHPHGHKNGCQLTCQFVVR